MPFVEGEYLAAQAHLCSQNQKNIQVKQYSGVILVWPPPCNSDHQDHYIFSREILLTFTFHCYREGAISQVSLPTQTICIIIFRKSLKITIDLHCLIPPQWDS